MVAVTVKLPAPVAVKSADVELGLTEPEPEYAQLYDVAPVTALIEYEPVLPEHIEADPVIEPGVAGIAVKVPESDVVVAEDKLPPSIERFAVVGSLEPDNIFTYITSPASASAWAIVKVDGVVT